MSVSHNDNTNTYTKKMNEDNFSSTIFYRVLELFYDYVIGGMYKDSIIKTSIKPMDTRGDELNGIVKKLTYNSVYTLNKKIANNEDYKRSNGKLFTLYPYDFWAGNYAEEDNYGKRQITETKNKRARDLDDELFESGVQNLLLAVNDLHNNPVKLSKVLVNIFKKDRNKIDTLEKESQQLKDALKQQKEKIELLEKTMYNLFYNSKSTRNSLTNVMNLNKSDDWFMAEQLQNAFCDKQELLEALIKKEEPKAEIISLAKKKKGKLLEELKSVKD